MATVLLVIGRCQGGGRVVMSGVKEIAMSQRAKGAKVINSERYYHNHVAFLHEELHDRLVHACNYPETCVSRQDDADGKRKPLWKVHHLDKGVVRGRHIKNNVIGKGRGRLALVIGLASETDAGLQRGNGDEIVRLVRNNIAGVGEVGKCLPFPAMASVTMDEILVDEERDDE
jgi:hypothetical protein